jgi:hypothetical protein
MGRNQSQEPVVCAVLKLIVSLCDLRVKPALGVSTCQSIPRTVPSPDEHGDMLTRCASKDHHVTSQLTSAVNQQRQPVPATLSSP